MIRMVLAVLAVALFHVGHSVAQAPTWRLATTAGPAGRWGQAMAYDATRGVVVLFGGRTTSSGFLGDTWTWDGSAWTRHNVPGPSARAHAAMAFDRARQRTILFGGTPAANAETWAWNGVQWTLLQPAQSPVNRASAAMAYDEARQRIVMFGGERDGAPPALGDTWEWDGSSWMPRLLSNAPPARYAHSMAYDANRMQTVLFGGTNFSAHRDDTWVWDGTNWQARSPATKPSARSLSAMAYQGRRQACVLFSGTGDPTDTWYWESDAWTRVSVVGPPGRWGHAMVYDEARDQIVLFGGANAGQNETWLMTVPGIPGRMTSFGQGCGPNMSLTSRSGSVPRVGNTFHTVLQGVPATATGAVMMVGASKNYLGPFPLPIALDFLGMRGCWLYQDAVASDPMTIVLATWAWSIPIPPHQALAGAHFYLQSAVVLPSANPASLVVSHAGDVLVGN